MTPAQRLHRALVDVGLRVRQYPGWETRGGSWAAGKPVGQMAHHTAAPVPFPVSRLAGSLIKCNWNTKPDGTLWLVAYGACNYSSGSGSSKVLHEVRAGTPPTRNARDRGLDDDANGNPYFWNGEHDHAGKGGPLPAVQEETIVVATRVFNDHFELSGRNLISHACWTARKHDPYWNGNRRAIDDIRDQLEITEEDLMFIAADGTDAQKKHGWPSTGPAVEYWQHFLRALDPSYDPGVGGWRNANSREFKEELAKFSSGPTVIGPGEKLNLEVQLAQKVAAGGGGLTLTDVFAAIRQALGGD